MIQDITSTNGGAIPILAHCVKVGSPIDVRQINMPHKRDRIARRKTSGRRMNTFALKNRGRYLRRRMPGNGKYIDIAIDATIREAAPYQMVRFGPNAIWADL